MDTRGEKLGQASMSDAFSAHDRAQRIMRRFLTKDAVKFFLAVLIGACLGVSFSSIRALDFCKVEEISPNETPLLHRSPELFCNENGDTILPFFTPASAHKPEARIPRRLFTTGKTRAVSPAMCKSIQRLLNMNPEWDFYMFGDDDIVANLQQSRYKSLQPLFDIVATGAIRADLWRYLVMFDYGGVYFDIDAWAWAPLRDFIPNDAAVVTTSMTAGLLCQWALMYRPGHFIMSAAANEAFQSVLRVVTGEEDWKRHEFEWKETVTGPPALSRAFERTSKLIRGRPEDRVIMYLTNNFGGKMQNRFDEIKKEQQAKQDGTAGNALWTDSSVSLFHVNVNRKRFIAEKNLWMERINQLLPDVESGPIVYRKGPESFIIN